MTDTAKPLTADEIGATKQAATWAATMWPFAPKPIAEIIPRFIATIEQQREQIERLRGAISAALGHCPDSEPPSPFDDYGGYRSEGNQDDVAEDVANAQLWKALNPLREALAAT